MKFKEGQMVKVIDNKDLVYGRVNWFDEHHYLQFKGKHLKVETSNIIRGDKVVYYIEGFWHLESNLALAEPRRNTKPDWL